MGKSPNTTISTVPTPDEAPSSSGPQPSSPPNPTSLPLPPSTPPPTFSHNQSANSITTTHSQPPPPYARPNPLSARLPGRSNLASQLNSTNTANHPRTNTGTLSRFPFCKDTDFTLRVVTYCVAVIGIVLFVACLTKQDEVYSDGVGSGIDIFGISALGSSAFESGIILISDIILLHQKKYPMHPAIPLTFDLMAWMAVLAMAVVVCVVSWLGGYNNECVYSDEGEDCNGVGSFLTHAERTATAMMFFAVILHFWIFVRACMAVDRQRKEIKEMKATLRAYVEMG